MLPKADAACREKMGGTNRAYKMRINTLRKNNNSELKCRHKVNQLNWEQSVLPLHSFDSNAENFMEWNYNNVICTYSTAALQAQMLFER